MRPDFSHFVIHVLVSLTRSIALRVEFVKSPRSSFFAFADDLRKISHYHRYGMIILCTRVCSKFHILLQSQINVKIGSHILKLKKKRKI